MLRAAILRNAERRIAAGTEQRVRRRHPLWALFGEPRRGERRTGFDRRALRTSTINTDEQGGHAWQAHPARK
jgi:hypothetical protein